ncbi:hypothetical protein H8356DRAFT_1286948 [Neocallimastix lanati (nom. inval.)]|jgi:hypothetical protein|uniref:Uncharacterized protein n=1 Tax=Neocallimastix californiae TaxID=1754190 RepID=A0A1Y2FQM5_9FUNG|nr:hypothetical protein H8356DRAFT_1286948 [Neocallimastix sp. JGI-2020a]ORY85897.1 hypothetical protein LY90DRAFT_696995 [Neocallimastix californiae]|eukprot:ORY85897.1 hypothetical protein LY90DRAFT_696995 [Neocallimastix californiae]
MALQQNKYFFKSNGSTGKSPNFLKLIYTNGTGCDVDLTILSLSAGHMPATAATVKQPFFFVALSKNSSPIPSDSLFINSGSDIFFCSVFNGQGDHVDINQTFKLKPGEQLFFHYQNPSYNDFNVHFSIFFNTLY